jgi:hypothetical protein
MAQHRSTNYKKQEARAKLLGCIVEDMGDGLRKKIFLPAGATPHPRYGTMYLSHVGELGFKPLKRFLDFLEANK